MNQEVKKENWHDVIGPVYRLEDLPPNIQGDEGLIILTTEDGTKCCPVKQFDPRVVTEKGRAALVVDEWVSLLWRIAKNLEIQQLGLSEWTAAGSILYPLQEKTQSVVDELFSCANDEAKKAVIVKYVERSVQGMLWNGVRRC